MIMGAAWDTLEKTEIRVERIGLDGANLTELAATVADVLGLPRDEVLVIDARDDLLALDVLRRSIDAYQLPDAKGNTSLVRYLFGESEAERQRLRDEVLGTTVADFVALADVLERVNA